MWTLKEMNIVLPFCKSQKEKRKDKLLALNLMVSLNETMNWIGELNWGPAFL